MNFSNILQQNKKLGENLTGEVYSVAVISNLITNQLNDVLQYELRKEKLNASISSGDYDNIIQDIQKFNESDLIIVFWELSNIAGGLQSKIDLLSESEVVAWEQNIKSEIDLFFSLVTTKKLVVFNKYSSLAFSYSNIFLSNFELICKKLNDYLELVCPKNVVLIDIEKIIAKVSINKSVDLRFYYSSKALYTIDFFVEYSQFIKPIIFSNIGKQKKVLVLDCDNTLWGGIVGEEGINKICLGENFRNGRIFTEVQNIILALQKKGIILCVCSKNNIEDVEEVFDKNKSMILKKEHFAVLKINWLNKVDNILEIAKELNLGLDSFVFLDDSVYEIELVKQKLPEVLCIQVPDRIHEYIQFVRDSFKCFFKINHTTEDLNRTIMYQQQKERLQSKVNYSNVDDYLEALNLQMTIYENRQEHSQRIFQLIQKTNQFNFTTKRYTENEVKTIIEQEKFLVYDIGLTDKFGDYGLVGVIIVEIQGETANIDTFLLSCRALGRNVEYVFLEEILKKIKNMGIKNVMACYEPTTKNKQVSTFYEKINFDLKNELSERKDYFVELEKYKFINISYIGVTDE